MVRSYFYRQARAKDVAQQLPLVTRTFRSPALTGVVLKSTGNKITARNTLVAVRGVLANRRQDFFLALFLLSLLADFAELVRFWRCRLPLGNVRKSVPPTARSCRRIRRAQLALRMRPSCCAVPGLAGLPNEYPAWFREAAQSVAEVCIEGWRPPC